MYDTILIPTEASPGAEQAVDLAVDFADRYDADLHVLHVVESSDDSLVGAPIDDQRAELSAESEEAIQLVEDTASDADVPVQTRIDSRELGEPQEAIIEHAERISADFVVMGTHGRTGISRLLVGSVAEEVIRQIDIPVVVVPLADDA